MVMETANGGKEVLQGCLEGLEIMVERELPFPVTTTMKTSNLASCVTSGNNLLGLLAVI
jgi:hypothetical protein